MTLARDALRVALLFGLFGAARVVDRAVGILLRTTLDLPDFVPQALALVDPFALGTEALAWAAGGLLVWLAAAALRQRADGGPLAEALRVEARLFAPLWLRPAVTAAALLALWIQPTYPYGSTFAVALTQDWAIAIDVLFASALLAARLAGRRLTLPAPDALSVFFLAFLAYAWMTPEWARRWENHPGNEPKTLRTAVAIGHWLTLDMEPVRAGMEELDTGPLGARAAAGAALLARESMAFAGALARGTAFDRGAIRATRETRQVVRGKDGGVFTVLAPGPSALLAPVLRVDRALNRARGTPGRLAVTVLFWNALAAALVAALFLLVRDGTRRPGLAALVAGTCAVLPPFTFYAYQFYPEMLGALALAALLHALLFRPFWGAGRCLAFGLLLATLPWLHQKFLPVWAVLAALAVLRTVGELVTWRGLALLVVPQVVSGLAFLLYNFAVTGSARPDALFLAWGPGGVSGARVGQGLLGLLLDARYGLVPYVPVLLLAFAGWALRDRPRGWILWAGLPTAVYYATVAAADNWSGATCNLGRYAMPALPFLVLLGGFALSRTAQRAGPLSLTLALAAVSLLLSAMLLADPHAANDCQFLLARANFADGNVYIPNLFLRSWADAAPGLWARVGAWIAAATLLAAWLRRVATGRGGDSAARAVAGAAVILFAFSLVLEHWPSARRTPRFDDGIAIGGAAAAFLPGRALADGYARVEDEHVAVLVRSRDPLDAVHVVAAGAGVLRIPGAPPLPLDLRGVEARVPLVALAALEGRRGAREHLARATVRIDGGPASVTVRAER